MRTKILAAFKKHPEYIFRKRELARRLSVKREGYRKFSDQLQKLEKEGVLLRVRGGGYLWAEKSGKVQGRLELNQRGFGFVLQAESDDIFISSRNLGGAMHGDLVKVAVLPATRYHRSEGKVVEIVERGSRQLIGVASSENGFFTLAIEPASPQRGIRLVNATDFDLRDGDAVVARVRDWGGARRPVKAKVIQVVGSIFEPEDDMQIVCHKFDLDSAFPEKVLRESERFGQKDIEKELQIRTDLRDLACFTIDPENARDFDDAVSLEKDEEGNLVMGVHIADVSSFVAQGSELDREARNRGTSVYFAEGTVHMLPESLSAKICSLLPNEDRLALSVLMTLDKNNDVKGSEFHRSVIRTAKRFSYREVQAIFDGKQESRHAAKLKEMYATAETLLHKRHEAGSIDFDIPEPIFRFQNGGIPHEIHPSERLDSHRLIEEFMLLANRMVAEKVSREMPTKPFIFRIHDKPTKADMERLLDIVKRLNLLDSASSSQDSKYIRRLLAEVEDSPYKPLIENLALRTMTKAIYSVENRGHYGLAFKFYTHFTSPIRRYPDLMVHRFLKTHFFKVKDVHAVSSSNLKSIAKNATETEIRALEAERDYIKIKQIRWLSQHIGEKFEGIISGVISKGFFVKLKDAMVEGFVNIATIPNDSYSYDETRFVIIGRQWKEEYQIGRQVTIRVQDVTVEKRQANFELVV